MAEPDDIKKQEVPDSTETETAVKTKTAEKAEDSDKKAPANPFMHWVIVAAVAAVFAGAGFGLGLILTNISAAKVTRNIQQHQFKQSENSSLRLTEDLKADTTDSAEDSDSQKTWYYDLEPVVANLDVPGVTRYVRATLTLKVSPFIDKKKGIAFLDEKNPLLTNWLTIYLASLNLEDVRGHRNLKRIQSQILDAFNEKLFPDAKPQIKEVLFKEFAIQ